jgi:hypothetical protein
VDLLTNAVGDGYGNHVENVETAYGKEVSVKMPFAPTAMVTTLGSLFIPAMRHKDGTYQQDTYDFEPRLLIADGTASGTWTLQATTQSVYPVTYFANNAASGELLGFDNVSDYGDTRSGTVAEYWADRLNRENNTRTLEAYLFIRDHEVQDFDHGMPTLVDDGSGPRWYYVQEIMGHRFGSGEPTKCRLVEIPGATIAASVQVVNPVVEYPSQPFACVGEGYASAVTSGSTTVRAFTSTGYLALRHAETGTFSAYGSGIADGFFDVTLGAAGTWCMWPVNPLGQLTGVVHELYANDEGSPGLVELHLNGWTSMEAVDTSQAADLEVLELGSKPALLYLTISDNTALTSLDLSGCDVLEVLAGSGCTSLVDIAPPPNTTLHSVVMVGGALDADSVDGLILKCDDTYSGVLDTTGGTSAAPTGAVAAYIALLSGPSGVGVTGAGAFDIDGVYTLSTPLNGRDRYTQTGAFIFWNGSHWRIQNGSGDIYEGTEDVMQPWLVTTWTPVGGTASPAPTVTAPGAGWTIATN